MKKVISVILAVLMVMSMAAVSAFAAETLPDGVYEVPFKLWHATKDQASMGNNFMDQTAKVTIDNGKITAEIKPVAGSGMDLSAFGFDVNKMYVKADQGNGNYVDSVINKDSKGNPVSASVPIPSQQEYTPIKLYIVDAMGEQDGRIRLDWANAKRIGDVPKTSSNTTSSNPLSSIFSTIKGLFSK